MPGAFQEWNWFNRAPTPEEAALTRNALIYLRDQLQETGQSEWTMIIDTAIRQLTYYLERERRN